MKIFENNRIMRVLDKSISAYSYKHRVISNNIANITTPGYKRKEVLFEEQLQDVLHDATLEGARSDDKHFHLGKVYIDEVEPKLRESKESTFNNGINNVDVDKEMVDLADNTMKYNMALSFMKNKIEMYKLAVNGR